MKTETVHPTSKQGKSFMTYDEIIEKVVSEGAIRAYRLSDSTAYAYRLKDNHYEARTLIGIHGDWSAGKTLVSAKNVGRSSDGWYRIPGLPKRALPIESEAAKKNPGYSNVILRQCYTCKKFKPEAEFDRPENDRNWECNEDYYRRQRELASFQKVGGARKGDTLERETLASPPPPQGKI
jgi:hypothetical protein